MTKVFETKEGVELFFDEEKYDYSSSNIIAVEAALTEDCNNYAIDPIAAQAAFNLLSIMENMDRMKEMMC